VFEGIQGEIMSFGTALSASNE